MELTYIYRNKQVRDKKTYKNKLGNKIKKTLSKNQNICASMNKMFT